MPTATATVVAADAPTTVTLLGGTGVLGAGVESLTACMSAETGATTRASVATDGTQANGKSGSSALSTDGLYFSGWPVVSTDGRYVAFDSMASNLVAGDTNGKGDVFVRDVVTGATTRVSVATDGTQANLDSQGAAISASGRYVAFRSGASSLVAGDTNGQWDVFVHDRDTGATTRVSVATDGTQANLDSYGSSISADGRYVAISSEASNLVAGDTNGQWDVFVHDRDTGATTRASVATDGTQANMGSVSPVISADGRYVAFDSMASNLVAGTSPAGLYEVFVHDQVTGLTTQISVATGGTHANNSSSSAAISADGRYVAFDSYATNLVAGDTNGTGDVFVRDRVAGATTRVSVASGGTQANGNGGAEDSHDSWQPAISADGRYVAFNSGATNLVAGDTNGMNDVFVRDWVAGATIRVSTASGGTQANHFSSSGGAAISAGGRYVVLDSLASNLVAGDSNAMNDVFVRDRLVPALAAVTG